MAERPCVMRLGESHRPSPPRSSVRRGKANRLTPAGHKLQFVKEPLLVPNR